MLAAPACFEETDFIPVACKHAFAVIFIDLHFVSQRTSGSNDLALCELANTKAELLCPSLSEEHTFRCEDCDELFQSKLDLRRHKKYACNTVSSLYETLNEEIKQEGLSDGQVYECKDCERMFPNKYRYHTHSRHLPG